MISLCVLDFAYNALTLATMIQTPSALNGQIFESNTEARTTSFQQQILLLFFCSLVGFFCCMASHRDMESESESCEMQEIAHGSNIINKLSIPSHTNIFHSTERESKFKHKSNAIIYLVFFSLLHRRMKSEEEKKKKTITFGNSVIMIAEHLYKYHLSRL